MSVCQGESAGEKARQLSSAALFRSLSVSCSPLCPEAFSSLCRFCCGKGNPDQHLKGIIRGNLESVC